MAETIAETERLILRTWRDDDLAPFHAMCSDQRIMATLGPLMDRVGTAALIEKLHWHQAKNGHCFWALESRSDGRFLGICGLIRADVGPIADKVEIGWRIAYEDWGQGYAREAAMASLDWGFANLSDDDIWGITTPANTRSWGLMERLGMKRHPELDFDHPNVPDGSPLKRHITYSIDRPISC